MAEKSILKKLGQGNFSLTFFWCFKKKEYILKCPLQKGGAFYKKWFSHIQKEILFLNKYAPKRTRILLPHIVDVSDSILVQEKVQGIPLTEEIYHKLPIDHRKKIEIQLANFFAKLHTKNILNTARKKKDIFSNKWLKFLDKDEKILYKKYIKILKANPYRPSHLCLCITDLKAKHILLNFEKQQLGLVDFGSIHFTFPEDEFILENPIRSHLSIEMLKNVLVAYNHKKGVNKISLVRVRCYLILFAIQEIYRCYEFEGISQAEKVRVKNILFDFVCKVENIFSQP